MNIYFIVVTGPLADRRRLERSIRRLYPNVDMLPAEQWPDESRIELPIWTEEQREALCKLGFQPQGDETP